MRWKSVTWNVTCTISGMFLSKIYKWIAEVAMPCFIWKYSVSVYTRLVDRLFVVSWVMLIGALKEVNSYILLCAEPFGSSLCNSCDNCLKMIGSLLVVTSISIQGSSWMISKAKCCSCETILKFFS